MVLYLLFLVKKWVKESRIAQISKKRAIFYG